MHRSSKNKDRDLRTGVISLIAPDEVVDHDGQLSSCCRLRDILSGNTLNDLRHDSLKVPDGDLRIAFLGEHVSEVSVDHDGQVNSWGMAGCSLSSRRVTEVDGVRSGRMDGSRSSRRDRNRGGRGDGSSSIGTHGSRRGGRHGVSVAGSGEHCWSRWRERDKS